MIIEINPLDTLFFRDGKPFSMGEETWADAIFPPMPSVIYGALRSAYFANNIEEFRSLKRENKLDTKDDPTNSLVIKAIYFKVGNDFYLPLPLDCVKKKDSNKDDKNRVFLLIPSSLSEGIFINNSVKNILIPKNKEKIENVSDGLVRISVFKKYLNSIDSFTIHRLSDWVIPESKIGISRSNKTHTLEEAMLYRVDMSRLKGISIIVEYKNLNIPEKGLMKLGGESKAVSYRKIDDNIDIDFPEFENEQFKLVLTTPAIFKNGWLPKWIDENSLEGIVPNTTCKIKLMTAAVGKAISVGGFDMKKRKPKPMYKAVPAGSVYYFEIENGVVENIKNIFHNQYISDVYSEQGFGICYVGKAKDINKEDKK